MESPHRDSNPEPRPEMELIAAWENTILVLRALPLSYRGI